MGFVEYEDKPQVNRVELAGNWLLDQLGDLCSDLLDIFDTQRQRHSLGRTEGVDQNRNLFADDVFKQQGRPGGFHDAVGDLGDFQLGIDRVRDPLQLAGALQNLHELC
jgi:hypothetical protein